MAAEVGLTESLHHSSSCDPIRIVSLIRCIIQESTVKQEVLIVPINKKKYQYLTLHGTQCVSARTRRFIPKAMYK